MTVMPGDLLPNGLMPSDTDPIVTYKHDFIKLNEFFSYIDMYSLCSSCQWFRQC